MCCHRDDVSPFLSVVPLVWRPDDRRHHLRNNTIWVKRATSQVRPLQLHLPHPLQRQSLYLFYHVVWQRFRMKSSEFENCFLKLPNVELRGNLVMLLENLPEILHKLNNPFIHHRNQLQSMTSVNWEKWLNSHNLLATKWKDFMLWWTSHRIIENNFPQI